MNSLWHVERFGYNNFHQDFKFMKSVVEIVMDDWWNKQKSIAILTKSSRI